MKKFINFLTEEYNILLLLEAKIDDFTNRWMKVHAEHPTVKTNPEKAREMIKHAFPLGQSTDEHMYIINQYLNGTLKPKEDDPTVDYSLKSWRRLVQRNLHANKKISDYDHNSLMDLFEKFPELQKKKSQATAVDEIKKYHIGQVQHPEYGTLDVYHIQQHDVKDSQEYDTFSKAMKKVCTIPGSTVCVQHSADHVKHYARGHGFFAYLDKEGTFRLGHGYSDRTIVRHNNQTLHGDEEKSIADQTEQIIKNPAIKAIHRLRFKPQEVQDSEILDNIEHPAVVDHIIDNENGDAQEKITKYITPEALKKILHSDKIRVPAKVYVIGGIEHNIGDGDDQEIRDQWGNVIPPEIDVSKQKEYLSVLKDPKLHDRLIDLGHHNILTHQPMYSLTDRFRIKPTSDHKDRVFQSFLNWKPKNLDIDYADQIPEGDVMHAKEHDIQHLIDHDSTLYFTPEKFEELINHPNFGIHHGRIAAQMMSRAIRSDELLKSVRSEYDAGKMPDLIKRAWNSDSPHLHQAIFKMATDNGVGSFTKNTGSVFDNLITNKDITRILDNAQKHKKIFPRDMFGTLLAYSKDLEANIFNRMVGKVTDDDFISSIFKSNNHDAKNTMLTELKSVKIGGESGILQKHLYKTLTKPEVEGLALSKHPQLMRHAISMDNFPETALHVYLKDKKDPMLAVAALEGKHKDKITPEHVEMAWDTHKSSQNRLFDEDSSFGHKLLVTYTSILQHDKVSERVKNEIWNFKNPILHHRLIIDGHLEEADPSVKSKILDSLIDASKNHPQRETQPFIEARNNVLRYLVPSTRRLVKGDATSDRVSQTMLDKPEDLVKITDNFSHLIKNHSTDFGDYFVTNLYTHPDMPQEILQRDYSLARKAAQHGPDGIDPHFYRYHKNIIAAIHVNPNISEQTISDIIKRTKDGIEEHSRRAGLETNLPEYSISDLSSFAENSALKGAALDDFVTTIHHHSPQMLEGHGWVQVGLAKNPNLEEHHVNKILDHHSEHEQDPTRFEEALSSNNNLMNKLGSKTIKSIAQDMVRDTTYHLDYGTADKFLRHPNLSSEHVGELLKERIEASKRLQTGANSGETSKPRMTWPNLKIVGNILLNPNSTEEHISHFIDHGLRDTRAPDWQSNEDDVLNLLIHPSVGMSSDDKRFGQKITHEEISLLRSKVTPEHIDKLYAKGFKQNLPLHPNLTDAQKTRFIDDYEKEEQQNLLRNSAEGKMVRKPNSNRGFIQDLSKRSDLSKEHVDRIHEFALVRHKDEWGGEGAGKDDILRNGLNNNNLSPELVMQSLHKDVDPYVFADAHAAAKRRGIADDKTLSDRLHEYISNPNRITEKKIELLDVINGRHKKNGLFHRTYGESSGSSVEPRHYEALMQYLQKERNPEHAISRAAQTIANNSKMTHEQFGEILTTLNLFGRKRDIYQDAFAKAREQEKTGTST